MKSWLPVLAMPLIAMQIIMLLHWFSGEQGLTTPLGLIGWIGSIVLGNSLSRTYRDSLGNKRDLVARRILMTTTSLVMIVGIVVVLLETLKYAS